MKKLADPFDYFCTSRNFFMIIANLQLVSIDNIHACFP